MSTIKEARLQRTQLSKDIRDLRYKRSLVATVEIAPGEDFHDYINMTVGELTKQIEDKLAEYYVLNEQIQIANNTVRTDADGRSFTIAGLVAKNVELRKELNTFKDLAGRNPRTRKSGYNNTNNIIEVATYDIEKAGQKAKELTETCNRISLQIDILDNSVQV